MKLTQHWLFRLLIALTLLVAVAALWLLNGLGRGPNVSATIQLPELTQPVRVMRDEHGIAYILAENTPDLIRAQGFVTAQHRLFQLESYRALASGRLAEAIGEAGLVSDRQMRLLGIARHAKRHTALLSEEAKAFLTWYAQGLNAYITHHTQDHPIELQLAGFTPRVWTLEDMVTVLHFVNFSQAANFKAELLMQKLMDRLGSEKVLAELLPITINPDRQTNSLPSTTTTGAQTIGLQSANLLADLDNFAQPESFAIGSNNWAIDKTLSAQGNSMLVNDPHLDARMLPGSWHPIGLHAPGIRAIGAALPAVPGIMVGRNEHVAFGVTNAYGDSQDLFIETPAPNNPGYYLDGDELVPFGEIEEIIHIRDATADKGMRTEMMTIQTTRRGPIISGPIMGYQGERRLSLRTAAAELTGGDLGIDKLLTARSIQDVDKAAQAMDIIYFNYVFADRDGAIGHRSTGRVPIRRLGQGSYPTAVDGQDNWLGFIPADQMPAQSAQHRHWVGTANHDNRPDDYAYAYSSYFSPPYRYQRMGQQLNQAKAMSVEDQRKLMLDTVNLQAQQLAPKMVKALAADPELQDLASLLAAWDYRDDQQQAAPLLYHHLYEQLAWQTLIDDLGEDLTRDYLKQWYVWQNRFDAWLATPDSPWFDDQRTQAVENLDDMIRRSAHIVKTQLVSKWGQDMTQWQWGDEHRIHFASMLRPKGWGRDWLGFAERPMSGSGETLMRARTSFMGDYQVEFFASMRLVADMADDDRVQAVVSGGVVDRQFHPHQQDQLPTWTAGQLLNWWLSPQQIAAHSCHEQRIIP